MGVPYSSQHTRQLPGRSPQHQTTQRPSTSGQVRAHLPANLPYSYRVGHSRVGWLAVTLDGRSTPSRGDIGLLLRGGLLCDPSHPVGYL